MYTDHVRISGREAELFRELLLSRQAEVLRPTREDGPGSALAEQQAARLNVTRATLAERIEAVSV